MKPSRQSGILFWAFVVTVLTIVVSVTAGAYSQSAVAVAETGVEDNLDVAYQVVGGFRNAWLMVLSVF